MSWQMDQIPALFQTNNHIIGLPVKKYIRVEGGGTEKESFSLIWYLRPRIFYRHNLQEMYQKNYMHCVNMEFHDQAILEKDVDFQ